MNKKSKSVLLPYFDMVMLAVVIYVFGTYTTALYMNKSKESQNPLIVYQVDNTGLDMIGKVQGKKQINGRYTLDLGVYGYYLVPKDVYDSVQVGDDIPDYVRGINDESR